jgi:hypothetical protein
MALRMTTEEHLAVRALLRKYVENGYSDAEAIERRVDKLLRSGILDEAATLDRALEALRPTVPKTRKAAGACSP